MKTHGKCGTPTYRSWQSMLTRCTNPAAEKYPLYGGRGISVCERWRKFENFLKDMGEKPRGLSIGRINNDGDYEPGNCRWETNAQQSRNKSTTLMVAIEGITRSLKDWCDARGADYNTVYMRIYRFGWEPLRALTEPNLGRGGSLTKWRERRGSL
jgi:hypothetical protein